MSRRLTEAIKAFEEAKKAKPRSTRRTTAKSMAENTEKPPISIEDRLKAMDEKFLEEEPPSLEADPYIPDLKLGVYENMNAKNMHRLERKLDQMIHETKKQSRQYAKLLQEQSKQTTYLLVGELDEIIKTNKKETDEKIERAEACMREEVQELRGQIQELKKAQENNTGADKDTIERMVNDKIKKLPKSSERQQQQNAKANYLRDKSNKEIIIRGIANDQDKTPIQIATGYLRGLVDPEQGFVDDWIKYASFKGKKKTEFERTTLVAIVESERIRNRILGMISNEDKNGHEKPMIRPGISASDRKALERAHRHFDELKEQGKIIEGAKCKLKGGFGHYFVNPSIIKKRVAEDGDGKEKTKAKSS